MIDTELLPRPQPVGVFPMPAGYLLIGDGPEHGDVRVALMNGKLPTSFPPTLRYYELALAGDIHGALDALPGDDPVSLVNRLVLDPDRNLLTRLRSETTGALAAHVEMVAFVVGLSLDPPNPAATDGEMAAMAHAAVATLALERKDIDTAATSLELAAEVALPISRPLAGQMLGQLANVQLDDGGKKKAQVTFQAALDLLEGSDLRVSTAELHVSCGAMYQEMSEAAPRLLKTGIDHYHAALSLIDIDTAPDSYAIANANLGLAYLTMPMTEASDQLRVGVAVQSLREALKVFTPEIHRDRWSSTQLNLANALVYMPSTHQAENIAEAVELYEAVLQHRDRHRDPHGRARVLANQGNALAHLGIFDEAKLRLHEARMIFEEFEEHEAVRSVRGILDEIAKHESLVRQDAL
jgi:tetratricopeptide (TPR) repeat protein